MQSFFWLVLSHPRVHERLVAELEAAVAAGAVPATGNVDWAQAQGLEYLQACLREAMRLRPAVGLDITRVVPEGGAALDAATRLPGGTRVALNGWVLHRDRAVFGADADVFRPERWIDAETGRATMNGGADSNYSFLTFLHGPRSCIGERFARAELRALVASLIGSFEVEMADPNEVVQVGGTITSKPINGMRVRLNPVVWGD